MENYFKLHNFFISYIRSYNPESQFHHRYCYTFSLFNSVQAIFLNIFKIPSTSLQRRKNEKKYCLPEKNTPILYIKSEIEKLCAVKTPATETSKLTFSVSSVFVCR